MPKPFTPFQWEPQDTIDRLREKQHMLQKLLKLKHVEYNWHDPETSFLEAVLARGDRRIGQVLFTAWQNGARFDSWAEYFSLDRWIDAFAGCGLDPAFYAHRKRSRDEVLPWDHIDTGVTKAFLWNEYMKALNEETTPDCRLGCTGCGVRRLGEGLC